MARKKLGTLSEQMYYVLLVLRKERCGAEIAEAVDTLTAAIASARQASSCCWMNTAGCCK